MDRQNRLSDQLVAALQAHLITGKRPQVPDAGRLLWGFFVEISASRTYHAAGPNPLSFAEIEAWARMHRWPLQPHHLDTIRAMDAAWLEHVTAKARGGQAPGKSFPRTGPAMTAEFFDAVFG